MPDSCRENEIINEGVRFLNILRFLGKITSILGNTKQILCYNIVIQNPAFCFCSIAASITTRLCIFSGKNKKRKTA
jgi:hypothetical protein